MVGYVKLPSNKLTYCKTYHIDQRAYEEKFGFNLPLSALHLIFTRILMNGWLKSKRLLSSEFTLIFSS